MSLLGLIERLLKKSEKEEERLPADKGGSDLARLEKELAERAWDRGKQETVSFSAFTFASGLLAKIGLDEHEHDVFPPINWKKYVHYKQMASIDGRAGGISAKNWFTLIELMCSEGYVLMNERALGGLVDRIRRSHIIEEPERKLPHIIVYGVGKGFLFWEKLQLELLPYYKEGNKTIRCYFRARDEATNYIKAMSEADKRFKGCKPIPVSSNQTSNHSYS